jgi:hypothetical protein
MTNQEILALLRKLGACQPAIEWAESQPEGRLNIEDVPNQDWISWIVRSGTPKYQALAYALLIERKCSDYILLDIVCSGTPKYKALASALLIERKCSDYCLRDIVYYGTPKYKALAITELQSRSKK